MQLSAKLTRDTSAKVIPAGDEVMLPAGSEVMVTQALGGAVTVRTDMGLFRIDGKDLDAFPDEVAEQLRPATQPAAPEGASSEYKEEDVWNALRACYDPEIPVNIVDLGLIYDLRAEPGEGEQSDVAVKMTLTAPGCGMGPTIAADAKSKIEALPSIRTANVEIVWDPQWTPHMISPEGRKMLGLD